MKNANLKIIMRRVLSVLHEVRAFFSFFLGAIEPGVKYFQRALDLNDEARLDILERIGPSPDTDLKNKYLVSGETLLMQGEDHRAGKDFAAAIVLSGSFSEYRSLEKMLTPIVDNDNLIITQVAYNYFPIFEIWYYAMQRLGVHNILLIALDPLTAERAKELGVTCYFLPIFGFQKSARRLIWTETLKVRQEILNLGVNYLHSDADAIWLKDVREQIFQHDTDFVTSIAYGTPKLAMESWGFVMCLGFYYCRSNENTRAVYRKYIELSAALGHDQNGLNQLFLDSDIKWNSRHGMLHRGECPLLDLSVTAVPWDVVARPRDLSQLPVDTGVIHPVLSYPTIVDKIRVLSEFGADTKNVEIFGRHYMS